jgi:predicted dehydrogenase
LLADPDIDAVINPLPNSLHAEWTIKAAEAGKHVLCEKPLAVSVDEARAMMDAAGKHGVLLMEAFTHRFTAAMDCVRDTVAAGTIGSALTARAELSYSLNDEEADVRADADLGGGAMWDAGCYCVSALRYALDDEPTHAAAFERCRENGTDFDFAGTLRFTGGTSGHVVTSQRRPFTASLEIVGEKGRVVYGNFFGATNVVVESDGQTRTEQFEPVNRFELQISHFTKCVLEKSKTRFPVEDAVRNTAALVALKQAARTGMVLAVVL